MVADVEIHAHLMLADHAAAVGGKLYINGGGWDVRPAAPVPWALALEIKVPWTDNNRTFPFEIELLDADEAPFTVDTPDGPMAVKAGGEMKLTAGPGLKPGSQIVGLAAALLGPLELPAGQQFVWKLTVDGHTRDEWRVTFATVAVPVHQQRAV